jgi:hypothetical protein
MDMQLLLIVGGLALVVGLVWAWMKQRAPRQEPSRRGKAKADGLDTLMSWHPQATRIMTASERKAYAAVACPITSSWRRCRWRDSSRCRLAIPTLSGCDALA